MLTEPLPRASRLPRSPSRAACPNTSFGHEDGEFGDIARRSRRSWSRELSRRTTLPLIDPGQRIRATVIGASQFTVQVSGKTIYPVRPRVLPVHNVPVVHVGHCRGGRYRSRRGCRSRSATGARRAWTSHRNARMAIAFSWHGDPEYTRLTAAGRAIVKAVAPTARTRTSRCS